MVWSSRKKPHHRFSVYVSATKISANGVFMLAEHYKFGHHVKFAILIKILHPAMSMQQNEMGAWFFLRIRGGIGRVGRNSKWAKQHFWKNIFLIFLGKKTPKKIISFPSCNSVSPSPHNLDYVEHFGKGILEFTQQEKPLWVLILHEFSCSVNCFPFYDCPIY